MWHVGINLHRETVVIAAVNNSGEVIKPVTVRCEDTETIVNVVKRLGPFRAVIEATQRIAGFTTCSNLMARSYWPIRFV